MKERMKKENEFKEKKTNATTTNDIKEDVARKENLLVVKH